MRRESWRNLHTVVSVSIFVSLSMLTVLQLMLSGGLSKSTLGNGGTWPLKSKQTNRLDANKKIVTYKYIVCIRMFVYQVVFPLNSYSSVCSLCIEGMRCCRRRFSSWKRQKEALTSSHAATGPSACSDSLTTACFLRSGLRLQRPSSWPVTSVSSLRKRSVSSWTTCQQSRLFPAKPPLSSFAAQLLSPACMTPVGMWTPWN